MIVSLQKEDLNYCLDIVEKALPIRSTVPVIENILLEFTANEIIFTATNLELDIQVKTSHSGGNGRILLPSKIVDIVRYLPASAVEMNFDLDNFKVDLKSGQSSFNLFGADPSDYPSIQTDVTEEQVLALDQAVFKQVLKEVIFAASTDESRPSFNGVLFHFKDKQLTLIASDTYRLVVKDMNDEKWSFEERRYLIPAKSLRELLKIMGDHGVITISPAQNKIFFNFNDVHFATRVLEEKYPDVSGVIPTEYKIRAVVERKLLEETVGRAALLAEGINQAAHFSVNENCLEVKVSSQIGRMQEEVQSRVEGETVELYVNSRFVMDVLKVIDHNDVQVDFHGKNGPLVFRRPGDMTYLYLVLPIKME